MSQPVPGPGAFGALPTPPHAGPTDDVARPGSARPGASDVPVTGDPAVDEALRTLDGVEDAEPTDQVAAFEAVHGALQDRLADAEG